jgi:hypothetical protein
LILRGFRFSVGSEESRAGAKPKHPRRKKAIAMMDFAANKLRINPQEACHVRTRRITQCFTAAGDRSFFDCLFVPGTGVQRN